MQIVVKIGWRMVRFINAIHESGLIKPAMTREQVFGQVSKFEDENATVLIGETQWQYHTFYTITARSQILNS